MSRIEHPHAKTAYAFGYLALLVLSLLPVWLVTVPPLVDYPNHLARMHILLNASDAGPLGEFYQVRWSVIPNLAMDLLVPPLAQLVPLEVAGKVFISLTLILLSSGALALNYALHRRLSLWPFVVFLLLYNGIFLYGILNFLFGLGLALWSLAAWIHLGGPSGWKKALLFHALSALLFMAHLSALGVFVLSVLVYELRRYRMEQAPVRWRQAAAWIVFLALGPAVLVLVLLLSPSDAPATQAAFRYGDPAFIASQKLGASLLLFRNYARLLDLITLAFVLWIVTYAGMTRRLAVDRRISGSLAALAAIFLVMPFQIFGANFADSRILLAAAFLFIAGSTLRASPRFERGLALGLLLLFGVRMGVLLGRWEQSDVVHAQYLEALEHVPEGARLLAAWAGEPADTFEPPLAHLASLAVIRKSVFLPSMYAMPRGQPIVFAPEYLALARQAPNVEQLFGTSPAWGKLIDQYDYVLLVREQRFVVPPPPVLSPVYEGAGFRLYRTPRASHEGTLGSQSEK